MKRKIVQFRYFTDKKNLVNYSIIDSENNPDLVKSLFAENKLFVKRSILNQANRIEAFELFELPANTNKTLDEYISEGKEFYQQIQQLNYPPSLYSGNLVSGNAFSNCVPIVKLGIQSLPGTRFRFNTNLEWIVLGATGLYEIDLKDSAGSIIDLKFDKQSINNISENENAYLIIDIMYEEED